MHLYCWMSVVLPRFQSVHDSIPGSISGVCLYYPKDPIVGGSTQVPAHEKFDIWSFTMPILTGLPKVDGSTQVPLSVLLYLYVWRSDPYAASGWLGHTETRNIHTEFRTFAWIISQKGEICAHQHFIKINIHVYSKL